MIQDLVRGLERIARAPSDARAFEWETLMYNRVSGLIKVLAETGEVKAQILEGSFAVLDIGHEIFRLHARAKGASDNIETEVVKDSLQSLSSVANHPRETADQLRRLSTRVTKISPELTHTLIEIADSLITHDEFLRRP